MKTVCKENEVMRVSDQKAAKMVKDGWKYCPKSVYKEKNKSSLQK